MDSRKIKTQSFKPEKKRAPYNRTLTLSKKEIALYKLNLLRICKPIGVSDIINKTICGDILKIVEHLPSAFVDLMIIDPPYNLSKRFNQTSFRAMDSSKYEIWLDSWLKKMIRLLKSNASVYLCGDWRSSGSIVNVCNKYFKIKNRVTWEREKGRGALSNWKNCSEDIWFCTMSENYTFNVEAVKVNRKVLAPYKDDKGKPKDWQESQNGKYRTTYPSNIWTDITIPFWSMPENTDHPTQKPEKLIAKLLLASSKANDIVFDPFLGVGTTSVVAKKLDRNYVGIEVDEEYCCLTEKRLEIAKFDRKIQGYEDGVFWERNSLNDQNEKRGNKRGNGLQGTLFK